MRIKGGKFVIVWRTDGKILQRVVSETDFGMLPMLEYQEDGKEKLSLSESRAIARWVLF